MTPFVRLGIFFANDDDDVALRSVRITPQAFDGLCAAVEGIVNASAPARPTLTAIKAAFGAHVGAQWQAESDDWFKATLPTLASNVSLATWAELEALLADL